MFCAVLRRRNFQCYRESEKVALHPICLTHSARALVPRSSATLTKCLTITPLSPRYCCAHPEWQRTKKFVLFVSAENKMHLTLPEWRSLDEIAFRIDFISTQARATLPIHSTRSFQRIKDWRRWKATTPRQQDNVSELCLLRWKLCWKLKVLESYEKCNFILLSCLKWKGNSALCTTLCRDAYFIQLLPLT